MRQRKYTALDDKEWLRRLYIERQQTAQEIADVLGCHRASVTLALQKHGIPAHSRGVRPDHHERLNDPVWLTEQYTTRQHSIREIAGIVNHAPPTVHDALCRAGVPTRPRGRPKKKNEERASLYKHLNDPVWLTEQYITKRHSIKEIASMVNCTSPTVNRALHRAGIPIRPPGRPKGDRS